MADTARSFLFRDKGMIKIARNIQDSSRNEIELVVLKSLLVSALIAFLVGSIVLIMTNSETSATPDETSAITALSSKLFISEDNTPDGTTDTSSECSKRTVGFFTGNSSTNITQDQMSKLTHATFFCTLLNSSGLMALENCQNKTRFLDFRSAAKSANTTALVSIPLNWQKKLFDNKLRFLIGNITSFLEEYELDGVDIFWNWALMSDKKTVSKFLSGLRKSLQARYLISIHVPGFLPNSNSKYNLGDIPEYVDFIAVYSMDYYSSSLSGPISPLYSGYGAQRAFNVANTMNGYTSNNKKHEKKFNLGIPFFTRLWTNVGEPTENGSDLFRHAGRGASMSRATAKVEGWRLTSADWDDKTRTSYIWNPEKKELLAFETDRSLKEKTDYIKRMGIEGVWIWAVDMDDGTLLEALYDADLCSDN